MIEEIENYINGEDYPDEIPKRIMGLFEREHTDLLAEVKRLRKQLEDCKRQIQETADLIRDRGEGLHAKDLDNFLEWME